MTPLFWVVAVALVLVGIAGTLLPALPGPVLVFAGLLLAAWADGFARIGGPTLVALGILTLAAYGVDLIAGALGVRRFGASRRAAIGAAVGTVVGLFFGLPGLVIGPFLGALIAELTARRTLREAGRAGIGAWVGFLVGTLVKLALVFSMVGLFAAAFFL